MRLFGSIEKIEEQDDGTVKVFGVASSEAEDADGEVILASAMKEAIPDYMTFGAVREMHQPNVAAGTAIEADVRADGTTWFGAHIVDPLAVKKVLARVYKGFSVGGKVTNRDPAHKNIITGMKLFEISLVDRPANPQAVFSLVKFSEPDTGDETMPRPRVKTADGDKVKKGMWDVSQLASLLGSLNSLRSSTEWEAQNEGDSSAVPGKLRDAVEALGTILVEMVAEETRELNEEGLALAAKVEKGADAAAGEGAEAGAATDDAAASATVTTAADAEKAASEAAAASAASAGTVTEPVEKKGAKFSASARKSLTDIHAMVKKCDDMMKGLGYDQTDDEAEKSAIVEAEDVLAKVTAVTAERDTLVKAIKEQEGRIVALEAEVKASNDNLKKLADESDKLVESLKAKGVLKVIGKGEDVVAPETTVADGGAGADPIEAMKKVHRGGGRMIFAQPAGA